MRLPVSKRVLRFAVVGTANAAISFGLLNAIYYGLNQPKILSSLIATAGALIFSFVMNRNFVFADKSKRARQQAPAFIIVTILGSFVILNLVYIASLSLLDGREQPLINLIYAVLHIHFSKSFLDINLSTVIGAAVAMIWNYNGYKWFVFKGSGRDVLEQINQEI